MSAQKGRAYCKCNMPLPVKQGCIGVCFRTRKVYFRVLQAGGWEEGEGTARVCMVRAR